ncbi:hypothetical protein PMI34_02813 [Pseudomonas sp. GM74]|uniref:hypothetical protein n=1 Tax=Pseudomonas sp. GM74 TaxID=1144336 RepID=UPI000270D1EF|nr:hypothetical protein [Pseudomonas sp. GM74]EJM90161.1 hypothetical protein PMI34_02813 [Pseudomonas sp. GM74]
MIQNAGQDRIIDLLNEPIKPDHQLVCASRALSLFAFSELAQAFTKLQRIELILPSTSEGLELLGSDAERAARNRLLARSLAKRLVQTTATDEVLSNLKVRRKYDD